MKDKKETNKKKYKGRGKEREITKQLKKEKRVIELATTTELSHKEISELTTIPERTVSSIIERYNKVFSNLDKVDDYKKIKHQILSSAEYSLIKSMLAEDKLADANVYQLAVAFREINKANLLEQGKATANIHQLQFTKVIKDDDTFD